MKKKIVKGFIIIKYIFILFISVFLRVNSRYNNVWIISERGFEARDNAYHLYKYIMTLENKPNIYYILDKKSIDYQKLKEFDNIVQHNSLKHWVLFAVSRMKISTHIMGYSPDISIFSILDKCHLVFGKKIFLQHGIIYNDLEGLYYPNVMLDLFICSAKPEYDYVINRFNHPQGVVKHLGMCRYDNLSNHVTEKIILIMPTWRSFLSKCNNDEEFKQTDYFIKYNNLINSSELLNILEVYDYKLIFYPHYELQKYVHCFEVSNDRIIIANKEEFDVQSLLKISKILITDFSSVFFDFAYMKKPIIFYHFDDDNNYRKAGYINLKECLFGKSVSTEENLIEELNIHVNNEGMLTQKSDAEIDSFFELRDTNNCKRVFNALLEL